MAFYDYDKEPTCLHGHDLTVPGAIHVSTLSGARTCAVCRQERDRRKRAQQAIKLERMRLAGKTHCHRGHLLAGNLVPVLKGKKGALTCGLCRIRGLERVPVDPSLEHRYTMEILRLSDQVENEMQAAARELLRRRLRWVQREYDRVIREMRGPAESDGVDAQAQ